MKLIWRYWYTIKYLFVSAPVINLEGAQAIGLGPTDEPHTLFRRKNRPRLPDTSHVTIPKPVDIIYPTGLLETDTL